MSHTPDNNPQDTQHDRDTHCEWCGRRLKFDLCETCDQP